MTAPLVARAGASAAWLSSLAWLQGLPDWSVCLVLGVGAALENLVPVVPADTFVVLGGFLSARGGPGVWWVFAATWAGNVLTALLTYELGHRHGKAFFRSGVGSHLLNPHQMERMEAFYERWGTPAIFITRFLPGARAVVPVFAGVSHMPFLPVAIPLALASAIWYGGLVWAGGFAGRNVDRVLGMLGDVNAWLLGVTALVLAAVLVWWWRTRRHGGRGG